MRNEIKELNQKVMHLQILECLKEMLVAKTVTAIEVQSILNQHVYETELARNQYEEKQRNEVSEEIILDRKKD